MISTEAEQQTAKMTAVLRSRKLNISSHTSTYTQTNLPNLTLIQTHSQVWHVSEV